MKRSRLHLSLLVTLLISMFGWLSAQPARAAAPGESIASSNGLVSPNSHIIIALYDTGNANLSLKVPSTPSAESLTLALMSGTDTIASWNVRSGEHIWGFANIPAAARLEIRNTGASALPYELAVYARAQLPAIADGLGTWSGISSGTGIQSSAQFDVSEAGLYRFAMTASSGAYQLSIDNKTILKTASSSYAPNQNDSTYYLSAGTHNFSILHQTSAPQTTWDVAVSFVGGLDTLPSTETSGILGGFASQERIPLQMEADSLVNVRVVMTGPASESAVVELYNGETKVAESAKVFGGELVWFTGKIVAGANALHITTDSSIALSYDINVSAVADVPVSLAGISYGAPAHTSGGNSNAHFNFPQSGLYSFQITANSGRFQFVLDQNFLQRTSDTSAVLNFTAFVPKGIHNIMVVHDSSLASTDWSLTITPSNSSADVLPFAVSSRSLGKLNDVFTTEWVALNFNLSKPVNILVKANGAPADAINVALFHGETQVGSNKLIYGGEEVWISTSIASGLNKLRMQTAATNTSPMSYDITIMAIPGIPSSSAGISYGQGLSSTFMVNAPVDGIYNFTLSFSEGTGVVLIDEAADTMLSQAIPIIASQTLVRVPLKAGMHTIKITQSPAEARSVWMLDIQPRQLGPWVIILPIVMN